MIIVVVLLVGVTAYFVAESLFPSSSFVPTYNATYGTFDIPVYSSNGHSINYTMLRGIKLTMDNEDTNQLRISSVSNSTFSFTPQIYYELQSVPLSNGSIVSAYVKTYEIYLGYQTIIIPAKLSPGVYNIVFTDGNQINLNVT
ncbi:hypothetical protein DFR87_05020 [Metallosphaera hakonensis JCM 8857 = DSM 7519]|uniref:Uncharacterized protein n=1 Tax=Metallosphaera hakonensis JCM 8857 = DSM 7519 TaxID=1293036 RepID=A0A2U9IWS9_9CREN|nr:hypothetical protein DFR87_05020 [Metallosphaera hakonensis JCM 8857 = DSM 7519]